MDINKFNRQIVEKNSNKRKTKDFSIEDDSNEDVNRDKSKMLKSNYQVTMANNQVESYFCNLKKALQR